MNPMTPVKPVPEPSALIDEHSLLTSITFFLTPAQRAAVIRSLRAMRERDRTGALLYEVRVGPYETLEDARLVIGVLERAHHHHHQFIAR